MSQIETLLQNYRAHVALPWGNGLAGPQKVIFLVYDPEQERRLRARIAEFKQATVGAGHGWQLIDISDSFGEWMAGQEYRDAYFSDPDLLPDLMPLFLDDLAAQVREQLEGPAADENTVVGLLGVGTLFGLTKASALIERVAPAIRGRLAIFFPGTYDGDRYRLLDARDGWNYLAVPIISR